MSPKSPRIELSNNTFAERKCQVFVYESETFHRRWPNGISVVKMGNKNPQNLPFPSHDVNPIEYSSASAHRTHHPKPQLRWSRHCRTRTPWSRHWWQWRAPNSPPKVPLPVDRSPNPTTCQLPASSLDPSDLWCQTASGSDPPFFHNALDRETDQLTNGSRESVVTIARSASNESDAA